jgi:hypothetical protein
MNACSRDLVRRSWTLAARYRQYRLEYSVGMPSLVALHESHTQTLARAVFEVLTIPFANWQEEHL